MRAVIGLLRVLFTIVILALLIVNLALMLSVASNSQKPPGIMNHYFFSIEESDMLPTLSPGDVLLIQPQPAYEIGEVVLYNDGERSVVHRIVGTFEGDFITMGDAGVEPDDRLLAPLQIFGEVVFYIPGFAPVLSWLVTPLCTVSLAVVWLLLILLPMKLEGRYDYD